jgi:uncharacterized membrane protein
MRIVQGPDIPASSAAPDLGRVEALEKIVKSILQRLLSLEEKIDAQEKASNSTAPSPETSLSFSQEQIPPAPAPAPSAPSFTAATPAPETAALDTEAVKKGLLSKMWKYLNDERPPKAA